MGEQPREYYRRLVDMAMTAGKIMMSAGAETHRVENTILHILATSEFTNADAFVLKTGITITISDPRYKTISVTSRVYSGSSNLSKVCEVNNLSREFCAGMITLEQAEKKLREIQKTSLYGSKTLVFSTMLASAGYAYVFGGDFLEALIAFFVGFFLGMNNIYLSKYIRQSVISDLLGATIVALSGVGISFALESIFDVSIGCQYIIAGSLMPLVPGTAFTSAVRDIVAGDYISGLARVAEVLITAGSIAIGVAFGLNITNWVGMDINVQFTLAGIHSMGLHAIFAVIWVFIATSGFNKIFSCPKKYSLICCLICSGCWTIYLLCVYLGCTSVLATFIDAMFVNIVSQILARKKKAPVTLFLIIGNLPLVPGYGIYKVAYDMFIGGNVSASLTNALLLVGAIALAILITDTVIDIIVRYMVYRRNKRNMRSLLK